MGLERTSDLELAAQVALVTGGGRGIGRAIALELAAAGARVGVMARSADQLAETVALIEQANGSATAFPADVTDLAAVQTVVKTAEQSLGPPDLLVNNAAVTGEAGPSWEVDPDTWWRCLEVNLRGPFLCARAVLPGMVARRRGRIVNVSSAAGAGLIKYASGYGVSKAALIRFSENLAAETQEHGIAVFAIHPGDVMTEMAEHIISGAMARWLPWARQHFANNSVPPDRAAHLVRWLAAGKGDALSGCFLSIFDDVEWLAQQADLIHKDRLYTLRVRTLVQ